MKMQGHDGWRRPENIHRSLWVSGMFVMGVVLVVCIAAVMICHVFETATPDVNILSYAYAHGGMIVAVVSMVIGFAAIHVTLKLDESVKADSGKKK